MNAVLKYAGTAELPKHDQKIQNMVVSFEIVNCDILEGWALCNALVFRVGSQC